MSYDSGIRAGLPVLVTGASRGIGHAVLEHFRGLGRPVAAVSRGDGGIFEEDGGVMHFACDVGDAEATRAMFSGFGEIGGAVLAAGTAGADPQEGREDHWRDIMGSNLDGAWRCIEGAAEHMPHGGGIVVIASVLGVRAVPDQAAYVAAKHGAVGLVKAMGQRLAGRGITVNAVCPGWVNTGMARKRWAELGMNAAMAAGTTPTGRITTPGEIASLCEWLLGPHAGNVTGQAIVMDGGSSL